jgi:WD40 repeat protein
LNAADPGNTNDIAPICWSNCGAYLVCFSEDCFVTVVKLRGPAAPPHKVPVASRVSGIHFWRLTGNFVTTSVGGHVTFLDFPALRQRSTLLPYQPDHDAVPATAVAISFDDTVVAVGYYDGTVYLLSAPGFAAASTKRCHARFVSSIRFVPDARTFITASLDNSIRIWEVAPSGSGYELLPISEACVHLNMVTFLVVLPGPRWIASGSSDHAIQIFSYENGSKQYEITQHRNTVITLAASPDGTNFCSGGADASVLFFSVEKDELSVPELQSG